MKALFYVSLCLLVTVVAVLYYFFYLSPKTTLEDTTTTAVVETIEQSSQYYENKPFGFSLTAPSYLVIEEFPEGGGAVTVTFTDPVTKQGFQIFVLPYGESYVTDERFKLDIPSGVIENMHSATVDGANGSVFYSETEVVGETFEVWFIENGLLYEVSAAKELESWLSAIMNTWEFVDQV